jgi:hypothetical protein
MKSQNGNHEPFPDALKTNGWYDQELIFAFTSRTEDQKK